MDKSKCTSSYTNFSPQIFKECVLCIKISQRIGGEKVRIFWNFQLVTYYIIINPFTHPSPTLILNLCLYICICICMWICVFVCVWLNFVFCAHLKMYIQMHKKNFWRVKTYIWLIHYCFSNLQKYRHKKKRMLTFIIVSMKKTNIHPFDLNSINLHIYLMI